MKSKITLVQIKIECLVCRFFLGLPQRTTYTVARNGFSGEINFTGLIISEDLQHPSARSTKLCIFNAFM